MPTELIRLEHHRSKIVKRLAALQLLIVAVVYAGFRLFDGEVASGPSIALAVTGLGVAIFYALFMLLGLAKLNRPEYLVIHSNGTNSWTPFLSPMQLDLEAGTRLEFSPTEMKADRPVIIREATGRVRQVNSIAIPPSVRVPSSLNIVVP